MTFKIRLATPPLLRTAVALAIAVSSAAAMAVTLPNFTFNPAAVSLTGESFTGNNILISDFSTVINTGANFTDIGFLSVSAIQNSSGATFIPTGLNSTYGLYFHFTGNGTGNTFTNLNYELVGFNGTATFGFDAITNAATETGGTGKVTLAHGSLISGVTSVDALGSPSASARVTFLVDQPTFFSSPSPFYNVALSAFTNTSSEVEAFSGGFRIRQGGGSVNFTSAVPEPETYALMLAGLGAVGFVARRRRSSN